MRILFCMLFLFLTACSPMNAELRTLTDINDDVNKSFTYRSDEELYGKTDYWALPVEFLAKGEGDCEDFALYKLKLIRENPSLTKDSHILILKEKSKVNSYHATVLYDIYSLDLDKILVVDSPSFNARYDILYIIEIETEFLYLKGKDYDKVQFKERSRGSQKRN